MDCFLVLSFLVVFSERQGSGQILFPEQNLNKTGTEAGVQCKSLYSIEIYEALVGPLGQFELSKASN